MSPSGSNCRSGCRERNHRSYAECLRAANVGVNMEVSVTRRNRWDTEIEKYAKARAEGIQPEATNLRAIEEAVAFSDKHGVAYDGGDKMGTLQRAGMLEA